MEHPSSSAGERLQGQGGSRQTREEAAESRQEIMVWETTGESGDTGINSVCGG